MFHKRLPQLFYFNNEIKCARANVISLRKLNKLTTQTRQKSLKNHINYINKIIDQIPYTTPKIKTVESLQT